MTSGGIGKTLDSAKLRPDKYAGALRCADKAITQSYKRTNISGLTIACQIVVLPAHNSGQTTEQRYKHHCTKVGFFKTILGTPYSNQPLVTVIFDWNNQQAADIKLFQ